MREKLQTIGWLTAAVLFFVGTIWMGQQTARIYGQSVELSKIGAQQQGLVGLKEEIIERVHGGSRAGQKEYAPVYYLTVSFPDQHGETQTVREKVRGVDYAAVEVGGYMTVRVLPSDWHIHEIVPGQMQKLVIRGVYFTAALGILCASMLFLGFWRRHPKNVS